jgi:hypothetical protein
MRQLLKKLNWIDMDLSVRALELFEGRLVDTLGDLVSLIK